MNCGLGNLDTLKQHLLAPALRATRTYDVQLAALGLGIAASFEKYCNRKFARVENDKHVCTADRDHTYVPRYPMEVFTSIELKADINIGWEMQTGLVLNVNEASGLVYWGAGISFQWAQMRVTYTGGFFFETLEPDDANYPSAAPTGAAALPDDLRLAWILQCKHVWQTIDPRGQKIVAEEKLARAVPQQVFGDMDLIPEVISILVSYRRMVML
jgi:hypothetical protein